MKKNTLFYIILILLLVSNKSNCQEVLCSTDIKLQLNINIKKTTSTFSILDSKNILHLFFISKKNIKHLTYDSDFKLLNNKEYASPSSSFANFLGHSLNKKNQINLYFSNNKVKKLYTITIDDNSIVSEKEIKIPLKKENYLTSISSNNKFHVLSYSIALHDNKINKYTFENDQYSLSSYDFGSDSFYGTNKHPIYLSKILSSEIKIIDENTPISIDISSNRVKIYPQKEELILSLDHNKEYSKFIKLSLTNNDFIVNTINTNMLLNHKTAYRTNSFFYKNRIYQIAVSRDTLAIGILNSNSMGYEKKYFANKDEEITFKNTSIIQENNSFFKSTARELEKTKQFFRKLNNSNIGISAYEINNKLQINIGGITEVTGRGFMMPSNSSSTTASSPGFIYNPTFNTYNSYIHTKSVFIKCLFNSTNLEHDTDEISKNAFDKITDYTGDLNVLETVFKYQDYFILGSYDKAQKKYSLIKFED